MNWFRIIVLGFFLTAFQANGQELTRILFILDASNSMNAKWGDQTRIESAKELLAKAVDSLRGAENLEIALRVYGHQSPITATYQDCNDTKLEIPFAKDNYDRVKTRIRSIMAKGTTPIARSLEAAAEDFPDMNSRNIIILITDGLEACDNDPCVIAKKLHDKGVKVTPFVIGLGLDLSYLEQFKCIGSYSEAETKDAFRSVLSSVINKALINTTVQINLNNINGMPVETDVTVFLYEAGTKRLMYTFEHTINRHGNPDTVVVDPAFKYDMVVNTIPKVEVKNITLKKNTHNTIVANTPQGYLRVRYSNATKNYPITVRVTQTATAPTINTQEIGQTDKYIVGQYQLEILTLPRMYKSVDIIQSSTTTIDIAAPGLLSYSASKAIVGQLFLVKEDGTIEWVCNLDPAVQTGSFHLQPGSYRIVYRQKHMKSTSYTIEKNFKITSNKTTPINL